MIRIYTIITFLACIGSKNTFFQSKKYQVVYTQGDVMIGGIFPVHKSESNNKTRYKCGDMWLFRGLQRMEAMLFAIDKINASKDLLVGIQLGSLIVDSCSSVHHVSQETLNAFVRGTLRHEETPSSSSCRNSIQKLNSPFNFKPVVSVVGGAYSSISIGVAHLLQLVKIPQISYASTSSALSDKLEHPLFARTVMSDSLQAKAISDIIIHFNWSYVAVIYSSGDYGSTFVEAFKVDIQRAKHVCIMGYFKINNLMDQNDITNLIAKIILKVKIVVLFARAEDIQAILTIYNKHTHFREQYIEWVASDGWGTQSLPVKNNEKAAIGTLSIELSSNHIQPFDVYFKNLNLQNNNRNIWFKEFWETIHEHNFVYRQESMISYVIQSVYAVAFGIEKFANKYCHKYSILLREYLKINYTEMDRNKNIKNLKNVFKKECTPKLLDDGLLLYKSIISLSKNDSFGNNIHFNKNGDGIGSYNIMNFVFDNSTDSYTYKKIGEWKNKLFLNDSDIQWPNNQKFIPTSLCSKKCNNNEYAKMQNDTSCCWRCIKCNNWEYKLNSATCKMCPVGRWPDANRTGCDQIFPFYFNLTSVYAIAPILLSLIGILFVVLTGILFLKNIQHPVVKASARELTTTILLGCLMCNSSVFLHMIKPTPILCSIKQTVTTCSFSVIYASILIKNNRLVRIFYNTYNKKNINFISPAYQLLFTFLLVFLQFLICIISIIIEPPNVEYFHPYRRRHIYILMCKFSKNSYISSFVYILILILINTGYAVKTRNVPANFNETKYIGLSMFATCIIWLSFTTLYYGTYNVHEIQTMAICLTLSLSASVIIVILYFPKCYNILYVTQNSNKSIKNQYDKASTSLRRIT
ncbi:Sweet taste receptor T1R2 [Intoshia linei]|uniref:Sweet taste receptor T1R2 n=1 Tax=Intoshia linei TaxID=1819745 RepID=A0A177B8P2_9BILA|nr:Sweet taste receptor T1R2 [Intoshia linei]